MADFRQRPFHEGAVRKTLAEERRRCASNYSSDYAVELTKANSDENTLANDSFLASFTKGLPHDSFGNLNDNADYIAFVNAINQQDASDFTSVSQGSPNATKRINNESTGWRGWESPRTGHYYDLQGPDADAVSMPPAPELGSEELIVEMAEVYALALLRDVSFTDIERAAAGQLVNPTITGQSVSDILSEVSKLDWFSTAAADHSLQEKRRRAARKMDHGPDFDINNPPDKAAFDPTNLFRGSGPGAKSGPHVSQFMLIGSKNREEKNGNNVVNSSIGFGRQVIDQKIETLPPGRDYMVHWNAYLDVNNGANFTGDTDDAVEEVKDQRRFITTPRDLAAYVRYDALYQAYLNACLYMLGSEEFSTQGKVNNPYSDEPGPGFPDGAPSDPRQAFASYGGPHILSLVTEVATRCLKAVRRQKFNYHRRCRPERIGALLTLRGTRNPSDNNDPHDVSDEISGSAVGQIDTMLQGSNLGDLLLMVSNHNNDLIASGNADPHLDFSSTTDKPDAQWYQNKSKFLLPMAFAEGSPMHPSYGAGHATVAGGCVTMLKAFFNTTNADGAPVLWPASLTPMQGVLTGDPENPSSELEPATRTAGMTVNGELNKLAANISVGRNMAGVHYYTDYYESLRMGERIATGILIEQMKQFNEPVEYSFESFDGDHVHILKNDYDYSEPRVYIHAASLNEQPRVEVSLADWWHRHSVSEEATLLFAEVQENVKQQDTETA